MLVRWLHSSFFIVKKRSQNNLQHIQLAIISVPNWPGTFFLLQNVDLDYENKAGALDRNPMNVVVEAGDIEPFIPDYYNLTVEILNVNDEDPQWVGLASTETNIDENTVSGDFKNWQNVHYFKRKNYLLIFKSVLGSGSSCQNFSWALCFLENILVRYLAEKWQV